MNRIPALLTLLLCPLLMLAQKPSAGKYDIRNRAADHFMVQLSSDQWIGAPDSINSQIRGNSRGANVYVMLDKPFANSPRLSVAFGLGISTSHIFLNRMSADITGTSFLLRFNNLDTLSRFSKYKIATAFAELPIEFRYFSRPDQPDKSFKFAIGGKVGTLLNAHSKGKNLLNAGGTRIQDYTQKLTSRNYFATTRLTATARVGYGHFTLFGAYSFTPVFKDRVAAPIRTLQIGLSFSGL